MAVADEENPPVKDSQMTVVVQGDSSPVSRIAWFKSIAGSHYFDVDEELFTRKIERVQPLLREIESNKGCFDPFLVSIGPYHYKNPNLVEGEKIKSEMANQFVQDSRRSIEDLYEFVEMAIEEARKHYRKESIDPSLNDNETFNRMIFVDGCFVIQFIYTYLENPVRLQTMFHVTKFVLQDLFLLENQLPFEVLKTLMSRRFINGEEEGRRLIHDFIHQHFMGANSNRSRAPEKQKHIEEAPDDRVREPLHLLEMLHQHFTEYTTPRSSSAPHAAGDWSTFRSAKELSSVGIHFKPSQTCRFTDVKFVSGFFTSTLTLPPITIDESTKSLLLNLVAFEASHDSLTEPLVTSFVIFMNALIDNPEDVQELRSKGILNNALGSDQDVSKVFNEISIGLVSYSRAFTGIKSLIENHYMNQKRRWVGEWIHIHFSRPWSTLALIWATVTLIQAFIQTIKFFASSRLTQVD